MRNAYKLLQLLNPKYSLRRQLTISYLFMSLIVLGLSSFLIYNGVLAILQGRSEQTTVEWFSQADNTLQTFRNEVEKISNLLLVDKNVQRFLENGIIEQVERIQLTLAVLNRMQTLLGNYSYIDSIYMYTASGSVIGTSRSSNITTLDPGEFRGLVLPPVPGDGEPRVKWTLPGELSFFKDMGIRLNGHVISTIRPVKSINQRSYTGALIVNIDDNAIVPLYNNDLAASTERQVYICDRSTGKILSHRDKSRLGEECPHLRDLAGSGQYGSKEIQNKQVIFYRMDDKGWILIKEVPISEFIRDVLVLRSKIVWIALFSLVTAFVLSYLWIRNFSKPIQEIVKAMERLEMGNIGIVIPNRMSNEFGTLCRGFNRMSLNIKKLMEQVKNSENEKRKLEIQMLQSRINPHFLLNTLNTIKWMAMIANADNIVNTVTALSNLLRPIIRSQSVLGTLGEELEYAEDYIRIMNCRYAEKVNVTYRCDPNLNDCRVPRLILQPIIENVLTHGLGNQVNIEIETKPLGGDRFSVTVKDDGCGIGEERLREIAAAISGGDADHANCGIGLRNVNHRIKLHFGESYGIRVHSELGRGTEITLLMPQIRDA